MGAQRVFHKDSPVTSPTQPDQEIVSPIPNRINIFFSQPYSPISVKEELSPISCLSGSTEINSPVSTNSSVIFNPCHNMVLDGKPSRKGEYLKALLMIIRRLSI